MLGLIRSHWSFCSEGRCCLPRERLNSNCEWSEPGAQPLDLQIAAHRQHLSEDVDTAIEIAVRSADAEHGRRAGFPTNGGSVDFGRLREKCLEKLFATAAQFHGTPAEVRSIPVRRDWRFVAVTAISFIAFYCLASAMLCRKLAARFSEDGRRPTLVAFAMASIATSLAGVHLSVQWFVTAEAIQIGSDHLSWLRIVRPTPQLLVAMFFAGVALFWLVAMRQFARVTRNKIHPFGV